MLFLSLSRSRSPRYSITNSTVPVLVRYSEPPDRPLSATTEPVVHNGNGKTNANENCDRRSPVTIIPGLTRATARDFSLVTYVTTRTSVLVDVSGRMFPADVRVLRSACILILRVIDRNRDAARINRNNAFPSFIPALVSSLLRPFELPLFLKVCVINEK